MTISEIIDSSSQLPKLRPLDLSVIRQAEQAKVTEALWKIKEAIQLLQLIQYDDTLVR